MSSIRANSRQARKEKKEADARSETALKFSKYAAITAAAVGFVGGTFVAINEMLPDGNCSFDGRSGIVTNNFNGSSLTLSDDNQVIYSHANIEAPATYLEQMQTYCDSGVLPNALENSFK